MTAPITNTPINYSIFHPSNEFIIPIEPPINRSGMQVVIDRYAGGGWPENSPEAKAANTYVTITNILNGLTEIGDIRTPTNWQKKAPLQVFPFAGQDLNAYYNRDCIAFFYDKDPESGAWYFTAEASDVVAHELGHAILDAYRPDLWNAASMEIWAFHEAFGDMVAMISILQYDEAVGLLLSETGGNLRQHNIMSDVAEGVSKILAKEHGGDPSDYIRSGINDFKYVEPETLPKIAPLNQLSSEPHSFSRIFFGAFYDIFVMIYETEIQAGLVPPHALMVARNVCASYLGRAIRNAPASVRFYESMAKTLLWCDWAYGGKIYHDKMYEIFLNRKILKPDVFTTQNTSSLQAKTINVEYGVIVKCRSKNCKLPQKTTKDTFSALSLTAEIDHADIWMPNQHADLYDLNGNLIHQTKIVSEEETEAAASHLIAYLKETGGCTKEAHTPFEISNGQLKRTMICCCGGPKNPNSPEFSKPYKPENNAGCCGGCRPQTPQTAKKNKVLRGCFIRYKVGK